MVGVGKKFKPHPNMKALYYTYLFIAAAPLLLLGAVVGALTGNWGVAAIIIVPALAPAVFAASWIPLYYDSVWYILSEEEVIVRKGVWWKREDVVPYSRITSVHTVQGPLSRLFGVGSVHVHTASFGAAAAAEASIDYVANFVELKDLILGIVKEKPLAGVAVGAPEAARRDVSLEILEELRRVREILEKLSSRLAQ